MVQHEVRSIEGEATSIKSSSKSKTVEVPGVAAVARAGEEEASGPRPGKHV